MFESLVRHRAATAPLGDEQPGITWLWAANGIWKRAVTPDLDILIPVGIASSAPGLLPLVPHVRWRSWPRPHLPSSLLVYALADARTTRDERQYLAIAHDGGVRLVAPRQQTSRVSVAYALPQGRSVLCDIHSHNSMDAYFSATDDADDTGVSVSVVIGRLWHARPQIAARLNVYGDRCPVPATMIFGAIAPFEDTYASVND